MADNKSEVLPRAFGKYTLLKLLASGGMGAVYLAASGSEGLEKLLAIKVVLPELAGVEFIRRFRDEAKVVVKLSHGNLVQVFDAGEVNGQAYLAMEFVEGSDLRTIWNRCVEKRVAFPIEVVVQIIKDALRGLSYAHRYEDLNLIHRDISPPNVLVTKAGEVKITDFGLALSSVKIEKTAPGLVFGKIPYMSPEQARGVKVDGRADIYPLGVMLWELLTGRRLFPPSGNSNKDLTERAKGPQVKMPSSICSRVTPELDEVVLRALKPEPDDRYSSAREMLQHLAEVQAKFWPGMDTDRVAAFMLSLFEDTFAKNKNHREQLLENVRKKKILSSQEHSLSSESGNSYSGKNESSSASDPVKTTKEQPLLGNRYRLGRMLGEGGMGQVFEAEHTDIGRRVAVKVLHRAYSQTKETLERFRREARATTTIGHPSIVDVLDFGVTDDGRCYYVMELLEGLSLADMLEMSAPIKVVRAIDITLNICDAIEAAHRAGVVHRDLKPDNVMLMGEGQNPTDIKVLDFGIARNMGPDFAGERLTSPGTALGTPEYMAPEQAAGEQVDQRADIYATCGIIYKLLTGKSPHTGTTPQEVLIRKLQYPARDISQLRSDLPVNLCEVIMAGLETDPHKRPQSAAQLATMLKRVKDELKKAEAAKKDLGKQAAVAPLQNDSANKNQKKSNTAVWVFSLVLASLVLIGTSWFFFFRLPESKQNISDDGSASNRTLSLQEQKEKNISLLAKDTSPQTDDAGSLYSAGSAKLVPSPTLPPTADKKMVASPGEESQNTGYSKTNAYGDEGNEKNPDPSSSIKSKETKNSALSKKTDTSPTDEDNKSHSKADKPGSSTSRSRKSASDYLAEGRKSMAHGNYSAASKAFKKAKNLPGGKASGLTALARLSFQRGDHKTAARLALDAIRAGGGNSARLVLGNAYFKMGLYKSAIKSYEQILSRNANHRAARRHREAALKKIRQN